jgi:molybdate transport system ATP-binding protein
MTTCANDDRQITTGHNAGQLGSHREPSAALELETPLIRADIGSSLRIGLRAGDLLLATESPRGLSARNILPGTIQRLERRDTTIAAIVDCGGTEFEVHLTLAARDALQLVAGSAVWVVVKTHSCHLLGS